EWYDVYLQQLYLRARWYDSAAGRFFTPDTIMPDFRNPQSINRYAYVLGNPLRYVDSTGHFADEELSEWLKDQYPDTWESTWQTWQQNEAWMDWLHTAQLGDVGAYLKSDGNIQWFTFGNMLLGGTLDSLHDTEVSKVFSLVDLYAGAWATGVIRESREGGFDIYATARTRRSLHISGYTLIDNEGEARVGHYKRSGVMTLLGWGIGKLAPLPLSSLAREGWSIFLNERGIAELVAFFGWVVSTEEDFLFPSDGCSVGDEAVYFNVLWGHQYVLPDGKPSWFWWGGK
ncbi:MAG: hypothetical protein JXA33_00745, partial [Anaerolineae bacterium]|nr:hypothetical protein [Anaerolineae bacterium]